MVIEFLSTTLPNWIVPVCLDVAATVFAVPLQSFICTGNMLRL